jgi:small-conductance mechanosensitive channel
VSFVVGVAYEQDLDEVRAVILDAVRPIEAVADDPAPEALVTELAASTVNVEVRGWVDSHQLDARVALDEMIRATKRALDDEGIEMPSDIVALQATTSFRAAVHDRPVTPAGAAADDQS